MTPANIQCPCGEYTFVPAQGELATVAAQRDALAAACRGLIEYRSKYTLYFQLEKADDYIHMMRVALAQMEES